MLEWLQGIVIYFNNDVILVNKRPNQTNNLAHKLLCVFFTLI